MQIHPNGSSKTEAVQRGPVQDESRLADPVDVVGARIVTRGQPRDRGVRLCISRLDLTAGEGEC